MHGSSGRDSNAGPRFICSPVALVLRGRMKEETRVRVSQTRARIRETRVDKKVRSTRRTRTHIRADFSSPRFFAPRMKGEREKGKDGELRSLPRGEAAVARWQQFCQPWGRSDAAGTPESGAVQLLRVYLNDILVSANGIQGTESYSIFRQACSRTMPGKLSKRVTLPAKCTADAFARVRRFR